MLSPKISMILNIAALVLSAYSQASWWTELVGTHIGGIITSSLGTAVIAMNLVLHAYSAPTPGPAVAPAKPPGA